VLLKQAIEATNLSLVAAAIIFQKIMDMQHQSETKTRPHTTAEQWLY